MSKLFNKMQRTAREDDALDQWLKGIQDTIGEQVSGLSVPEAEPPADNSDLDSNTPTESIMTSVEAISVPSFRRFVVPDESETIFLRESDSNKIAHEAYSSLRTRLLRQRRLSSIRSLVVSSAVAGEGKTSTAINFGICCARLHNFRVLIVDGDLRTGGASHALQLEKNPGLANILEGTCDYQSAVCSTNLPNLFLLSCGESLQQPSQLFADENWAGFIQWAMLNFELVIVDSPPIVGLADFELIAAACDAIVAVARSRFTDKTIFQEAISKLDRKKLMGVVLNASEHTKHSKYSYLYHYAGAVPTTHKNKK